MYLLQHDFLSREGNCELGHVYQYQEDSKTGDVLTVKIITAKTVFITNMTNNTDTCHIFILRGLHKYSALLNYLRYCRALEWRYQTARRRHHMHLTWEDNVVRLEKDNALQYMFTGLSCFACLEAHGSWYDTPNQIHFLYN